MAIFLSKPEKYCSELFQTSKITHSIAKVNEKLEDYKEIEILPQNTPYRWICYRWGSRPPVDPTVARSRCNLKYTGPSVFTTLACYESVYLRGIFSKVGPSFSTIFQIIAKFFDTFFVRLLTSLAWVVRRFNFSWRNALQQSTSKIYGRFSADFQYFSLFTNSLFTSTFQSRPFVITGGPV